MYMLNKYAKREKLRAVYELLKENIRNVIKTTTCLKLFH